MPTTTISRCGGTPAGGSWDLTVAGVAPLGTLRGWWKLGELASPFADSSAYPPQPDDQTVVAGGVAYTTHVAGALTGGQDDGALQFNADNVNGYFIQPSNPALFNNANSAISLACWAYPFTSANTYRGGMITAYQVVAGSPSYEQGWVLEGFYSGGGVTARMTRAQQVGGVLSAGVAIPFNAWTFVVGTYDGSNLRIYTNGLLQATTADARADGAANYGSPAIGVTNSIAYGTRTFYGVLDEVACWSTVLSLAQIQQLYAAR